MGRQNYFTGCLSALLMDVRSANLSLYDFPMLKYMSSLSYWVCLLFSIGHGTEIYVALCDHTNHPSLLVTIKSFSLFLKALWIRFHYELTYHRWSSACEHREGKHSSKTPLWSIRLLCLGESQGTWMTKDDFPRPNLATWKLDKQVTLALPRVNGKRWASWETVHPTLK